MSEPAFESWAILELMGHRQRAGLVREVDIAGGKLLRIDIPVGDGGETVTEFYGTSAVYALRPSTEEIARRFVRENYGGDPRPIAPVGYRIGQKRADPDRDSDATGDDGMPF